MCCGSCWRGRQGFSRPRKPPRGQRHVELRGAVAHRERGASWTLRVYIFSMSDIQNGHAPLTVVNLIDYSVVPRTNPPAFASGQLLTAYGSGVRSQRSYRVSNARIVWFRKVCEFFLGSAQNKHFVVHLRALNLFDGLREWNRL